MGGRTKAGQSSSAVSSGVGNEASFDITPVTRQFAVRSDSSKVADFFNKLLRSGPVGNRKSLLHIAEV